MCKTVDWRGLVFGAGWLQKLDTLAARRFGIGGLAEEASTYVINHVSNNDWAVLRKFQGQSKPATYLYIVVCHFLEEFSRKRFGRPRPPVWIRRQGELWIQVWRAVCLERQEIETIVDRVCADGRANPVAVRKIAKLIKARALTQVQGLREFCVPHATDSESLPFEEPLVDERTPDVLLARERYDDLLVLMARVLDDKQGSEQLGLGISAQEAKALNLVYQEGHKRTAIACKLGVAAHAPGRMIIRALNTLRQVVEARGGGVDVVREQGA
ncbi:MAG: hypothetical protein AABY83_07630 [Pseudomonadota bacterium]